VVFALDEGHVAQHRCLQNAPAFFGAVDTVIQILLQQSEADTEHEA